MKVSVFIMFVCIFQLYASTGIAQNAEIKLASRKTTIEKLFSEIEKQTNYLVVYSNKEVAGNTNISLSKTHGKVSELLNELVTKAGLKYEYTNNYIVFSKNNLQQEKRKVVKGIVKDSSGEPIIGANIIVKGTSTGTITDIDGKYSLEISNNDEALEISYIGYQKQSISIGNKNIINVTLIEDTKTLEEVVVVGYGTMKKSDLTGSVSSVSSKLIEKEPVTNLASALQGHVPGTVISNVSGAPGSSLKVRIRGSNSVLGSNDPLYVVDGVVLDIGTSELNVNDIASVEVLKDASATAIYGSRGANGVVLITTKQGSEKPTAVQFTSYLGVSNLPKKYDLLDAASFAEVTNSYDPGYFTDEQIASYKKNGGVDWQDEVFQTGITQNYQIGVSGGGKTTNFYFSGNYVDQTGIVTNTKMDRYYLRSNINTQVGKKMKLSFMMTGARTNKYNTSDNGSKGSPVWLSVLYPPTFSIYTDEGSWNRVDNLCGPNYSNPLMTLKERNTKIMNNSLTANAKLSYEFFKGLKLDIVAGFDNMSVQTGTVSNEWISTTTSASLSEAKTYSWQNSNVLTYNTEINGIHNLTVMLANEQSYNNYTYLNASGQDLEPISVGYYNLGLANTKNATSSRTQYTLRSYFGRLSYSLLNKYLLTATYRIDGTSKFQGKNKWGHFPSVALAWRMSEEPFMKKLSNISNLKLRASWGKTGNQGVDPHATIAQVANWSNSYGTSSMYPGTYYVGADNPDLKWETTAQGNLGFDASFFNGRLGLSADYYIKNTSDLLLAVTIPAYDGGGTVNKNVGKVRNKGFEITLTGTPIATKNLNWDLNFNISHYKNTIKNLGNETFILSSTIPAAGMFQTSPFALMVGESMGSFYGYTWKGIYKSSEAEEAAKYGLKPGDNKYLDYNGDGTISSADQHIIGCALPKFTAGLNSTVTYKNLSLNIMLQGSFGQKILNTMYASASTIFSDATAITSKDGADFWTSSNDNAKFANPLSSTSKNYIASTEYLEDGSYVKIKNIGIAYNLKKSLTRWRN